MILQTLQYLAELPTKHPIYLLSGGMSLAVLLFLVIEWVRSYFSEQNRILRKLCGHGVVYRFCCLELLVGLAAAAASTGFAYFNFPNKEIGAYAFLEFTFRFGHLSLQKYIYQNSLVPQDHIIYATSTGLILIAAAGFLAFELNDWYTAKVAPAVAAHPPQIKYGDVPYVRDLWTSHLLLLATTRWGKSTALAAAVNGFSRLLIPGLYLDNAGNFLSKFYVPEIDLMLSLSDARAAVYSFFNELRRGEDIRRLWHNIIPTGVSETAAYFNDMARNLCIAICEALWIQGSLTNGDLCAAFKNEAMLVELLSGTEWPDAIKSAHSWGDIKRTASIYMHIFSQLPPHAGLTNITLSDDRITWKFKRVGESIRERVDFMGNGYSGKIFAPYLDEDAVMCGPFLSMITTVFCDAVMRLGEDINRRIVAIIDEGGAVSKIAKLNDILTRGAKYGLSTIFCVQNISQLRAIYGDHEANILLGNFNSLLIGRLPDAVSAEWASDTIGKVYRKVKSTSTNTGGHSSGSESTHEELRYQILPLQIQHLPNLQGILIYSSLGFLKRITLQRSEFSDAHERHVDLPASAWLENRQAGSSQSQPDKDNTDGDYHPSEPPINMD